MVREELMDGFQKTPIESGRHVATDEKACIVTKYAGYFHDPAPRDEYLKSTAGLLPRSQYSQPALWLVCDRATSRDRQVSPSSKPLKIAARNIDAAKSQHHGNERHVAPQRNAQIKRDSLLIEIIGATT